MIWKKKANVHIRIFKNKFIVKYNNYNIDIIYKINIVNKINTNRNMKKILLLLLLIGISSCCKDDDIKISWNIGIYHDARVGTKYLTIEMYPSEGSVQDVELSALWIFQDGTKEKHVLLSDDQFKFDYFYDRGIQGRSIEPQNYILDDYRYELKEFKVCGRLKINGSWYAIDGKRKF